MQRQLLFVEVARDVIGGGLANQVRLLGDVGDERTARFGHDLQGFRTGVDGGDFHVFIASGLFQRLDNTDCRLIPAGHVNCVELTFRVLAQQFEGFLPRVFRGVGKLFGQLRLNNMNIRVIFKDIFPLVVTNAANTQGAGECVKYRDVAFAAQLIGHITTNG